MKNSLEINQAKETLKGNEEYPEQMRNFYDSTLEASLGKPRFSRDMIRDNPNGAYVVYPVGGPFEGFSLINKREVGLIKEGRINLKDTALKKVEIANNAERSIEKKLVRGEKLSLEELRLTAHQFKIHLQPKKEFLPVVFKKLVDTLGKDEELGGLVPVFKASTSPEIVRDENGQVVPEIVLYCSSYNAMRSVTAKLEKYLKECEDKGNGFTPRFNLKINNLMYVTQSGADFKNELFKHGLLDEYYDKNYNYAVRNGTSIYSREPMPIIHEAKSFVELFKVFDLLKGGLMGSDELYRVAELKIAINKVREGKKEISTITSSGGLRQKVQELLQIERENNR